MNPKTAPLATGADAVCAFVNDKLSRETLTALSDLKIGLIALRCAGFNNVDLEAAKEGKIFFRDLSEYIIDDEKIMQLMTFPNVLVTAHQAFLTRKALT